MQKGLNVFAGTSSVKDFLNPDNHPPLPLVELPASLNPFADRKVRIFAKLMSFLPLANVKSLPALNMLVEKERDGELRSVESMIENSSGNTVFSLAVIGRAFGVKETKAIVSHEVSPGKLQLLRFFGTHIQVNEEPICPDPRDKTSGIYMAREIGTQKGIWNPGQYDNAANPDAHERWTGPQIWEQTGGKVSLFCAGLGTTGTVVGTGRYLKGKNPRVRNLGVVREPNNPVPGVRTKNLLQEIAFDWNGTVDHVVEIGTIASFEKSLELCRSGILAGPSSGFVLAGLLDFLQGMSDADLDRFRNEDGEAVAVFVCPDSPFPYIQEYFDYLGSDAFPSIENEHLLKRPVAAPDKTVSIAINEIAPKTAYESIYDRSVDEGWRLVNTGKNIPFKDGVIVFDVRDREDYEHNHLSQSVHLEYKTALLDSASLTDLIGNEAAYVICAKGNRSRVVADMLTKAGIRAVSVKGGMMDWSSDNLPRWRPDACVAFQAKS